MENENVSADDAKLLIRKQYLANCIETVDLYDLTLDQLEQIATIVEEILDKKDRDINKGYMKLFDRMIWVSELKIGDEVAYKDGSYYSITEVTEVAKNGCIRIAKYNNWVDVAGNYTQRAKIVPITQKILDYIEKEELVKRLRDNTRFGEVSLEGLRDIENIIKRAKVVWDSDE